MEPRLKEENFTRISDHCFDMRLLDFYICANTYSLTDNECSKLGLNISEWKALEHCLDTVDSQLLNYAIVNKLRAQFNSLHGNISLQSVDM